MIVLIGELSLRQFGLLIGLRTVYQEVCSSQPRLDVRREIGLDGTSWMSLHCAALRGRRCRFAAVDVPDAGSGVEIVSCTCG